MMRSTRFLVAVIVLVALAGVAYVGQALEPSGARMAKAADRFLASLTPEQKAKAVFAFDDKERLNWHFVPLQDAMKNPTRKGLRLEEMTKPQKDAALEILKAGTSSTGYVQATAIMSLEAILRDLEKKGTNIRNPEWYFFTLFGQPSPSGKWGWRVEGHHLSLNFVVDGGKVVASTPAFFGANPAIVKAGPKAGTQTLAEAEELARQLARSLDAEQIKLAKQEKQFGEIAGAPARQNQAAQLAWRAPR